MKNQEKLDEKAHELAKLIQKDQEHEEIFQKNYYDKVEDKIDDLTEQQKIDLIYNYEETLHEYLYLYLTLCIELAEEEGHKEELKKIRESIENHTNNSIDQKLANAEKEFDELGITDRVTREMILQKIRIFDGPLGKLKFEELSEEKLHKISSECNETIERTEGRDIARYSQYGVFGAELVALASVQHESKNTKVTIWRRVLENFLIERDTFKNLTGKGEFDSSAIKQLKIYL